jgi:hypothetical protein
MSQDPVLLRCKQQSRNSKIGRKAQLPRELESEDFATDSRLHLSAGACGGGSVLSARG